MRKRIKGLAVMLIALPVFLTSCGNENNIVTEEPSTTINNENDDIKYSIYKSGVESGTINGLSYEEWISSIKGKDGVTPTISIDADGYWVINGENTNIKAKSKVSIGEDNYWYIDGVSTGIKAKVDDNVINTINFCLDNFEQSKSKDTKLNFDINPNNMM